MVSTRERLQQELVIYEKILSKELYNYFLKLLGCEVSVFCDDSFMNTSLREEICGLGIYRKLAIYNIYHHALDMFHQEKYRYMLGIYGNLNGIEGLQVEMRENNKVFPLFLYDYSKSCYSNKVGNCGNVVIGDVDLYLDNVVADDAMREEIICNIYDKIRICGFQNGNGSYLKPYYMWNYQHKDELNYYYHLLDKIQNQEDNGKVNELQEYFFSLFLKKYGLEKNDSFDKDILDGNVRTFIREYPGGSVRKHIRYI